MRRVARLGTGLLVVASVGMITAGTASAATDVVTEADIDTNWFRADTRASGTVTFEAGPAAPPLGSGSVELQTTSANTDKAQLLTDDYDGVLIADIQALSYDAYRSAAPDGSPASAALEPAGRHRRRRRLPRQLLRLRALPGPGQRRRAVRRVADLERHPGRRRAVVGQQHRLGRLLPGDALRVLRPAGAVPVGPPGRWSHLRGHGRLPRQPRLQPGLVQPQRHRQRRRASRSPSPGPPPPTTSRPAIPPPW